KYHPHPGMLLTLAADHILRNVCDRVNGAIPNGHFLVALRLYRVECRTRATSCSRENIAAGVLVSRTRRTAVDRIAIRNDRPRDIESGRCRSAKGAIACISHTAQKPVGRVNTFRSMAEHRLMQRIIYPVVAGK